MTYSPAPHDRAGAIRAHHDDWIGCLAALEDVDQPVAIRGDPRHHPHRPAPTRRPRRDLGGLQRQTRGGMDHRAKRVRLSVHDHQQREHRRDHGHGLSSSWSTAAVDALASDLVQAGGLTPRALPMKARRLRSVIANPQPSAMCHVPCAMCHSAIDAYLETPKLQTVFD
jgi:hypothetical protein